VLGEPVSVERTASLARSRILIKEEEKKKLEYSYSRSFLFNRTKQHKMSLLDRYSLSIENEKVSREMLKISLEQENLEVY
jgi:DNA polymerase III delta prime subunit